MTDRTLSDAFFGEALEGQVIMGVFRNLPPDQAVARAKRAWDAGVENVEIPVQTIDAMPTLEAVIAAARVRGRQVGAGTIVSIEQLDAVISAGAAYSVSPGFDAEVALASLERGVPHLPGVATASEIMAVRRIGLHWAKAFPASVLGASWIKAMRGPFPDQHFVVTGGMSAATAASFLDAGACTVAMSDAFDDSEQLRLIRSLVQGGSEASSDDARRRTTLG